MTTNDDIIKSLSKERQERIDELVKEDLKKWGGSRKNSGRKTVISGKVLNFTKRVTEKEAQFIDYARSHNINYDDLMQD